ncbi:hypothetical protein C0J52_14273 [Blattella germanica]|nr:hypothetical protein C0J52_14273 [Blattella germanica]
MLKIDTVTANAESRKKICRPIKGNPQKLIRQAARELGMKRSTVLRHRLRLYTYKVQIVLCICIPPHNVSTLVWNLYFRNNILLQCHY